MANSIGGDISEGLCCPVCFEIPEAEVYECENGHWLCSRCYFQINPPLCPECRSRLDRDRPRRCRPIERILEGLKVDCAFKSNGCDRKLRRGSAQDHQAECIFNFDKFGQFLNLCKGIGYPNCVFKFNNGNIQKAVEHFVMEHGFILTTSEKFQMELTSFTESAKAGGSGFHFWTPIIADLEKRKCYILTMVVLNKIDASFTWVSIFLPYLTNGRRQVSPVEIEYTVKTSSSLLSTTWIQKPISLKEANELLSNEVAFVNNSLPFVQGCSKDGSLLIDCKVRRHGVAVPEGREQMQSFVCTRNTNSISVLDNIQLHKPKVTVRFKRLGASSTVNNFSSKLRNDCMSNRNNLLPLMRNLFEGKSPASLTHQDVERLKTDLIFVTAQYGNAKDLKYLIGKGANFNIVDGNGRSPLHYTMMDKDKKIGLEKAKLLVDSGTANVHVLNDQKWSLLHNAARFGNSKAVEYFLQKGCDVNAADRDEWTPLFCAVYYNSDEEGLKMAQSLVVNGADLYIKSNRRETALDIATKQGKTKIAQLLRSHRSSR